MIIKNRRSNYLVDCVINLCAIVCENVCLIDGYDPNVTTDTAFLTRRNAMRNIQKYSSNYYQSASIFGRLRFDDQYND